MAVEEQLSLAQSASGASTVWPEFTITVTSFSVFRAFVQMKTSVAGPSNIRVHAAG